MHDFDYIEMNNMQWCIKVKCPADLNNDRTDTMSDFDISIEIKDTFLVLYTY